MRRIAIIASLLASGIATTAEARAVTLNDQDLNSAVSGKTVKISTPIGLPLTVNYGANGIMVGTVGTALAAYLGSAKDRGRWKIRNGKLCQKWFKWLASEEICMQLRQSGETIHWRTDEGRTGTAMIEAGPPVIAGASASALGVPLPVADQASTSTATESAVQAAPTVGETAVAATVPQASAATATEPRLIEPLLPVVAAVLRPAPQRSAGGVPHLHVPFTLASAGQVAVSRPVAPRAPPHLQAPETEPAVTLDDAQPMRIAADLAASMSLEQRWCHTNALGGPMAGPDGSDAPQAGSGAGLDAPNLLAIAMEQVSPGELPLHTPACLTTVPVLHLVSKLGLR